MFGSPKISTRQLIRLSRQMAVSLNAGIDIRSAWAREVERASGWTMRARYRTILEAVKGGESVSAALAATDDYFPPLFREILAMGEESGHLGEAFAQLADHYETRARMANALLAAMIWPAIELAFALVIVAALIYVPKALANSDIDILGLGLVGAKGVQTYALFLLMVAAGIGALVYAMRRGVFWVRPIQKAMLFVPAIGNVLRTLALARIAWSLQLTFNTSMSVRRALRLSLNSAEPVLHRVVRPDPPGNRLRRNDLRGVSGHGRLPQRLPRHAPGRRGERADRRNDGPLVKTLSSQSQRRHDSPRGDRRVLDLVAGCSDPCRSYLPSGLFLSQHDQQRGQREVLTSGSSPASFTHRA